MNKYSVIEIEEFKDKLIQLKNAEVDQIESYEKMIKEMTENGKDENSVDNTSYTMQLESLTDSKNRCLKHLQQIENALMRIGNKVYGVCVETGKQIPKERLKAVPTTTLSMEGKFIRASRI